MLGIWFMRSNVGRKETKKISMINMYRLNYEVTKRKFKVAANDR